MRKMESGWKAYFLSSQKYVLSLGFFIAEMSQETGPRHTTPIASKDFPSISMTRHMKRCWRVSVFSTEQTEQRIFLAFPGDFAKLCKNFCHFQFHFAHAHCGTKHLLATPEELCKALRLLRLSQDPQCILGA